MIKFKALLMVFPLSLYSCSSGTGLKEPDQAEYTVVVSSEIGKDKTQFSELFSEIKYIPLETSDDVLIKNISMLKQVGDYIYILDTYSHTFFSFNLEGEFCWKINTVGKGPEEYIHLTDFDIDAKNNRLYLFSRGEKTLLYDLSGKFLVEYSMPIAAISLAYNKDRIYAYIGNNYGQPDNCQLLTLNMDGSILSRDIPFLTDKSGDLSVYNSSRAFYHYGDEICFYMPFLPNIYKIVDGVISLKYHFDFGEYELPGDYFEEYSLDDLRDSKYAYGLNSCWENEDYLVFKVNCNQKYLTALYSKKEKKILGNSIYDDMAYCFPTITEATNELALGYRSLDDLQAEYNYSKAERKGTILERIIEETDEYDNPVIFLCYFK